MLRSVLLITVAAALGTTMGWSPSPHTKELAGCGQNLPERHGALYQVLDGKSNNSTTDGCPQPHELPITDPDLNNFIGARIYNGAGHIAPQLACNGIGEDLFAGTRRPVCTCIAIDGNPCIEPDVCMVGSLYVHAGCTLHAFGGANFTGDHSVFTGPIFHPTFESVGGNSWSHEFKSMTVDCKQRMPSCTPTDDWKMIGYINNQETWMTTSFTYSVSIGTHWSSEMLEAFSIGSAVENAMKTKFFRLFEELVISEKTSYNWCQASSEAKSDPTVHTQENSIGGGKGTRINQAKGFCGGTEVRTDFLKSHATEYNANG